MTRAYLALGSNLGDRLAYLQAAVDALSNTAGLRLVAMSRVYDTAPVGYLDQPRFLNGAVLLETELKPEALLEGLLGIERAMGRDRTGAIAKGPRVIDLDLLLFGGMVLEMAALTVPHPAMRERRFVLEPLAEIAPGMVDPLTGRTVAELLEELGNRE